MAPSDAELLGAAARARGGRGGRVLAGGTAGVAGGAAGGAGRAALEGRAAARLGGPVPVVCFLHREEHHVSAYRLPGRAGPPGPSPRCFTSTVGADARPQQVHLARLCQERGCPDRAVAARPPGLPHAPPRARVSPRVAGAPRAASPPRPADSHAASRGREGVRRAAGGRREAVRGALPRGRRRCQGLSRASMPAPRRVPPRLLTTFDHFAHDPTVVLQSDPLSSACVRLRLLSVDAR